MSNNIKKLLCENFGSMGAFAPHSEKVDAKDTLKFISRYADYGEDFKAIQNFDRINMGLTTSYSPRNDEDQQLIWSLDNVTNNINKGRGRYDRFFWSGAIQERGSEGFAFTSTEIDGKETDGMAIIPCPYTDYIPGKWNRYVRDNPAQNSFKIKLKFNDLPANTFVPLFGYVYSHTGNVRQIENASGEFNIPYRNYFDPGTRGYSYHQNKTGGKYTTLNSLYNIPGAISKDDKNLYQSYPKKEFGRYHNNYTRNTVMYFLYAHDGEGNGMIATCAGEGDTDNPSATGLAALNNNFRPSNEHYGINNGFLKFKAPHVIQNYLDQGNSLKDLWDFYGPGGDAGNKDYKAESRWIHSYCIEDPWYNYQSKWQIGQLPKIREGNHARVRHGGTTTLDLGRSGSGNYRSYGYYPGPINYSNLKLIHYGNMGTNFKLNNYEELEINANAIGVAGKRYTNHQISTVSCPSTAAACQIMYSGKLLNYNFRDVPGQMFKDNTSYELHFTRYSMGRAYQQYHHTGCCNHGVGSHAVVLRPTSIGKGEVSSVSIASYDSAGPDSPARDVTNNYKSNFTTKYLFPNFSYSYEATKYARDTPSDVPTDKWTNPSALFDFDIDSTSQVFNEGEANALIVPLKGSDIITNKDDALVTDFTIMLRGLSAASFKEHRLKMSVLDSTKTKEVFNEYNGKIDDIEVPINSSIKSPMGDGAFTFQFKTTETFPIKYSDIKNCFLKVWAEEK